MPQLEFTAHEATVHKAIVVSFDLGGFSDFCNQPEASIVLPKLIKRMFDLLNIHFVKTASSGWADDLEFEETKPEELPEPSFIKFTGDGALMLWVRPQKEDFSQEFCDLVVEKMRSFQRELMHDLPNCEKEWRVHRLPKRVRVGIATGIVYALRPPHTFTGWTDPNDYVGYCINLAVRLQNYCHEAGFLVHGALHPTLPGMVVSEAIKMKGTQEEPVMIFEDDLAQIPPTTFQKKFRL